MGLDNFLYDRITEEDTFRYTLSQVLQFRAENTPDKTSYIFLRDGENDEERTTYREFDLAVRTIAHRLVDMNLRGERALMLYPPGLDYIRSLFACFYTGIIAVPAYPPRKNRSLDRLKTMVIDSGACIVLTTSEILQSFERSFQDVEELKSLKWLATDTIPQSPDLPIFQSPNLPIPRTSLFSNTPPALRASRKGSWSRTGTSSGTWNSSVRAFN